MRVPEYPCHTHVQPTPLSAGIVQGKATVKSVHEAGNFRTLELEFPGQAIEGVQIGASVAVNGTCLTVTKQEGGLASFDVIAETLERTNLGDLQPGQFVNFERAARFGDEIGGHTVSGHICTTATIIDDVVTENNRRLEFGVRRLLLLEVWAGLVAECVCIFRSGDLFANGWGWGGASQGKGYFSRRPALPLMAWCALPMMYRLLRSPTPCVDQQPPSSRLCSADRPFLDQVCDAQGVCEHRWLQPDGGRGRRLFLFCLPHSRNAPVSPHLSVVHQKCPTHE